MKRSKDDQEKTMGPMFPRLHINDTEKGGPRAPPRNKMALYEQLSIPSHRITRVNYNPTSNLLPCSSQLSHGHQSEKQYSQYSDVSTLTQVEQRKKSDEDEYRVPIFIHSIPNKTSDTYTTNNMLGEKHSPSNLPYSNHSLTLQTVDKHNIVALDEEKRYSSNITKDLPSDQIVVVDLCDVSGQMENLETGECVSEISILDVVSELDTTPDDVMGVIGQKHFWKARRAIANQQRVFAVQVFELHRLIKVQKSIAASPHLLLDNSAYFTKPVIKPYPTTNLPSDNVVKPIPNTPKRKRDSNKPTRENESSTENTVEKSSHVSSAQNGPSNGNSQAPCTINGNSQAPSTINGYSQAPSTISSDRNNNCFNSSPCFNQPQGQQWLIPVMTLSEGLVYKPYPGPGFVGQGYGGCGPPGPNPMMGGFMNPSYYVPAPPPQYHFQSFPHFGPHGYFPHYGMPVMNAPPYSGSSAEQMNPGPPNHFPAREANVSDQRHSSSLVAYQNNGAVSKDIEVQANKTTSPSKKQRLISRASSDMEDNNARPLFPTACADGAPDSSPQASVHEGPTRVIKVVPRNGLSASESAARIFRSIQEERKQCDSVCVIID